MQKDLIWRMIERIHVRAAKIISAWIGVHPCKKFWVLLIGCLLGIYISSGYCFFLLVFYGALPTPLHHLLVKRKSGYILRNRLCFNVPSPKTNNLQNSIS